MGRHSSKPEVVKWSVDHSGENFGVRRVLDPDDEFAAEQWLAKGQFDDELTWREYPGDSGWTTRRYSEAVAVCAAYCLGYDDASVRATIPPLGS